MPSIKYFSCRGGWLWANDVLVPRKVTPGLRRDGVFLYSSQASFSRPGVDLARLLRRACSRSFWIISFEFVKVCGIRFSIWESFIGFYICCYSISTILACLFEFRGKSCVERENGASPTLSQINECLLPCIIYRFSQG